MRWGVGKGRFRNLTATILCVFLALSFLIMWSFFRRIDPLTIDTSPRSQHASISDRLINKAEADSSELRQSDLLLFLRIADSVSTHFERSFPVAPSKAHAAKWQSDTLPERMRQVQVETRKTIAYILNASFTPITQYRRCESLVMMLVQSKKEDELRYRWLLSMPLIENAQDYVRTHQTQYTISEAERQLIAEFQHDLQRHMMAFELGLSSDSLNYLVLQKKTRGKGVSR